MPGKLASQNIKNTDRTAEYAKDTEGDKHDVVALKK
jgi:hypothetical protein